MRINKHAILAFVMTLAVVLFIPSEVLASSFTSKGANATDPRSEDVWKSTYNNSNKMDENYTEKTYIDQASHMQPGDDLTFVVWAVHDNNNAADWYVSNDVIKSLEDAKKSAAGSNYTYILQWDGPGESRELYNSENIGGNEGGENNRSDKTDSRSGLEEADNAMDEYIFLENMKKGDSGKVTLKVTLDGETEGNAYFDTFARLKVRFAVEPNTPNRETVRHERTITQNRELVRTGDETRLFPLYVAMFVSGVALMGLLVWSIRDRRNENEEATR